MTENRYFATAPKYLERLLEGELRALGIANAQETRGGVGFSGGLREAYLACLWSRLANSVLLTLDEFDCGSEDALYAAVQNIDWSTHFGVDNTFAIDANLSQSALTHSQYAALKVKDAIVDQFRERDGARPSVDTQQPDIRINLYVRRDRAILSLDLSGDSLHRRGYREQGVAAPLKENLAAALLLRADWPALAKEGYAFLDPMCGSGTLPIEAALMATDTAPGLLRGHWGFTAWRHHDAALWQTLLREAEQRSDTGLKAYSGSIRGYDQNVPAIHAATANIHRAGLRGRVHVERLSLENATPMQNITRGLIVTNPPYGERLGSSEQIVSLYSLLGRQLKERFLGWKAAVFTGNPETMTQLGLHYTKTYHFFNGPIACELFLYDINTEAFKSTQSRPKALPADQWGEGAEMFANRLRKNAKNLSRWLTKENIRCYRLYDADLPEYALAVDVYEGEKRWVHAQEYQAPKTIDEKKAKLRLREALGVLLRELELTDDQLFLKVRKQQKGLSQYEKLAETKEFHVVEEGGLRFEVNFEDYLDTGLFLDHRITRKLLRDEAQGKDFLNLFAYTGSASVYVAAGGARRTTTVDMSRTYLEWAQRNMALNGFNGEKHEFVQADCLKWIDEAAASRRRFDLIFLDPPSFSTSKRMEATFDVQRDHCDLISRAVKLLAPRGVLFFSTNLRGFKLDEESLPALDMTDLSRATLPKDFERDPKIHRCWRFDSRGV